MNNGKKIFLAGHKGMVGSAILKKFHLKGFSNFLLRDFQELDLRDQVGVNNFFRDEKPEIVILAAAKVGGINANIQHPADFLYDNLMIQSNVLHASSCNKVEKLVFLGSSCIYPRECQQPMREEFLLDGKLEPTNEGYALAKISGIKLAQYLTKNGNLNTINIIPCNLYGPEDSFDAANSHVLSALVKKFVDAVSQNLNEVTLWGTGIARREFMHVMDLADAVLFTLEKYNSEEIINIGWGKDISIMELSQIIAFKVGFSGNIVWDSSRPDGMLRKCMDVTRMKILGFQPMIKLDQGIEEMITIYKTKKLDGDQK